MAVILPSDDWPEERAPFFAVVHRYNARADAYEVNNYVSPFCTLYRFVEHVIDKDGPFRGAVFTSHFGIRVHLSQQPDGSYKVDEMSMLMDAQDLIYRKRKFKTFLARADHTTGGVELYVQPK